MNSIALIVNPAAGRGSIRRILPDIVEAFRAVGIAKIYETARPGEQVTLATRALNDGAAAIVAVGGDGTSSGIANAILQSRSACRLAVVPVGTGNDFAKTLGVEKLPPQEIAKFVQNGQEKRIDVGLSDGRYFLNSCGFGFDASVLEASNRVRFLKGDAVYIYSALRQLFVYRGIDVVASGAPGVQRGRMLMITVSNGRFLGGAFKIAPHASVLDGKLDACFFSNANIFERVKLFAGALHGTHLGMPSVSTASVRELALTFANNPLMEIDGELRSARSKTVELKCIPRTLSVVAAPGALV